MALINSENQALQRELDFLYDRINLEQRSLAYPGNYKLGTMRALLERLGNPERDYRIVHVAGTKGKGSVSNMIAQSLSHAGLRAGTYNSPHLESIHERISLNGRNISDSELLNVLAKVHTVVRDLDVIADSAKTRRCSYFEIITAAAMLHFSETKADWVVLEVGLGGRLDSTNVCSPSLCVITNVSIDHTKQLGKTVSSIAREKAGIVKPGVPVVSGAVDPEAQEVIHEVCRQQKAPLIELQQDFHVAFQETMDEAAGQVFDTRGCISDDRYQMDRVELTALGQHQAINAGIAIAALIRLSHSQSEIDEKAIRNGLKSFRLKGRFEIVHGTPKTVLDISHNVAAIEALTKTISDVFSDAARQRSVLIFATSGDKDIKGMLNVMLPEFDTVVLTRFLNNRRAVDPSQLHETAASICEARGIKAELIVLPEPQMAWKWVQDRSDEIDLVCVTGSAFLVAEVRPIARQSVNEDATSPTDRACANGPDALGLR